jgi:hypothetical protein
MKILKILFSSFIVILLGISVNAQKVTEIKGTIGKEKSDKMLVICVFGTKACLPVEIDTLMKVDVNGQNLLVKDLPVGLYIEAKIEGRNKLKSLKTDIDKTVICFSELNTTDEVKLNNLLGKTIGVKNFKFYSNTLQVYIEFEHTKISYTNLEKLIIEDGFKLE